MKFNSLIPELSVSNLEKSLHFYVNTLGFKLEYERNAEKFAFVSINEAQIMLEEINHNWETAPLQYPFGRGINFQIEVNAVQPIIESLKKANQTLFRAPKEQWYAVGTELEGVLEFLVQDPDGYLLRFLEHLGTKPNV